MSDTALQSPAAPFDAVAERYDEIFTDSRVGTAQRRAVWSELEDTFGKGDRVLEIGCGTGVDACFLAERGIRVIACDSSPRMLSVAARRVSSCVGAGRSPTVKLLLLPAENLATLQNEGPFNGAFSNFGAINCVQDFELLAKTLHDLLAPAAKVLLCLLGPRCGWEIGWYLAHGKPRKAFRRMKRGGVTARIAEGTPVKVHYPTVGFMARTFAPHFHLTSVKGVGVTVPPSYLEYWANRFPALLQLAVQADLLLGRCPGLRQLADHILLEFEHRTA